MLTWVNPMVWFAAMGAYARDHFVAWHVSSAWSWVGAFGLSAAYPEWARELVQTWYPFAREAAATLWEWAWSGYLGP